MSNWIEISIALTSAITGGGLFKVLEGWVSRTQVKSAQAKQFRDELRTEASDLRAQIELIKSELKTTEKELDDWKDKYWNLFMEYKTFQIEVSSILIQNGISPKEMLKGRNNL